MEQAPSKSSETTVEREEERDSPSAVSTACSSTFLTRANKNPKKQIQKKTKDGRNALLSSAARSNARMVSEFDSFLKQLESKGLVLAQDVETKELLVLSESELEAKRRESEAARRKEAAEKEEFIAPIPPSARIEEENDEDNDEEEEELGVFVEAAAGGRRKEERKKKQKGAPLLLLLLPTLL